MKKFFLVFCTFLCATSIFGQFFGKSLDFATNGQSYVQLTGSSDFGKVSNFQGAFTFEAWVNSENSTTWSRVFDFGDSQIDYIMFTPLSTSGECRFELNIGGTKYLIDGGTFPGGWNHVATTLSSSGEAKIYINGIMVNSASGWPTINNLAGTTKNYLGKSQFPDPYFQGKLDEVRVWKVERTEAEINSWMTCELSGAEEGLFGYFKMNQGLSNGPSTFDDFIPNFANLADEPGELFNFGLIGNNGNWVGETQMSLESTHKNHVEFRGSYDKFVLNNESNFDFDEAVTVEFWMNINDADGVGNPNITIDGPNPIIKYDENDHSQAFYMDFYEGGIFWGKRNPNNTLPCCDGFVGLNVGAVMRDEWRHYALTMYEEQGGLTFEAYIDGVLVNSHYAGGQSMIQNNGPVEIGRNVEGKMSNIRIWNRRLSSEEIAEAKLTSNYPVGSQGLVSQFNQFSNINSGLLDNIGGNAGSIQGTPDFEADPCFVSFDTPLKDTIFDMAGASYSLAGEFESCNESTIQYQWYKNNQVLSGENSNVLNFSAISPSDKGRYYLEVTTPCGSKFSTNEATIDFSELGNVLDFDGIDDYVEVELPTPFYPNQYTIETRIKFDGEPYNQNILVITDDNGPEDYYTMQLRINKDGVFEHGMFDSGKFAAAHLTHRIKAEANVWYDVRLWITNGGDMFLAINNDVVEKYGYISGINGGNRLLIGHPACGHDSFSGQMEDLRVWSTSPISTLSQELVGDEFALEYYFKFNEGFGNQDNSNPPVNKMANSAQANVSDAMLYNFELKGDESNWLSCGSSEPMVNFDLQPQSQSLEFGQDLTLSVSTSGVNAMYQWYKNGLAIPGATDYQYNVTDVDFADEGQYHVLVTAEDQCASRSETAEVIINGSGNVINLDGENDYILIRSQQINSGPTFTAEAWIKLEGDSTLRHIFSAMDGPNPSLNSRARLYTDASGVLTWGSDITLMGEFTQFTQQTSITMKPDQWYHIAALLDNDGSQFKIFVDGIDVSLSYPTNGWDAPFFSNLQYFVLGGTANVLHDGSPLKLKSYKGEIDEFRVWQTGRTATEILANKDQEIIAPPFNLIHYLKFNRGIANENNNNPPVDFIPDFAEPDLFIEYYNAIQMFNFDFQGPESNWSDCSPIANPAVTPEVNDNIVYNGQEIIFEANSLNSYSLYNYQWLKDNNPIPGATDSIYKIAEFMPGDSAFYSLEVGDFCIPQKLDTVDYGLITPTCYIDLAQEINYSEQNVYSGCTAGSNPNCSIHPDSIQNNPTSGYCGTSELYSGPMVSYHLPLTEGGFVQVMLKDINGDVDLFLLDDNCDVKNCLGSSTNLLFQDELIDAELPPGDYYIIAHSKSENGATFFNLEVNILENRCALDVPFECGTIVSANNEIASNLLNTYCTNPTVYDGNEVVYSVVLDDAKTLTIDITNATADFDLFLLDSICGNTSCIASSLKGEGVDESIVVGLDPGLYYIVVDAPSGVTGSFDIEVECHDMLNASVLDNDAYIDLNWYLDKEVCVPQDTGVIVKLLTTPNTILYEETYNTAAVTPEVIVGEFRHFVGPEVSRDYIVRVYNRLTDVKTCQFIASGSTTPFTPPTMYTASDGTFPDSIQLSWINHSQLSDQFRIYRDGVLIENLVEGYAVDSLMVTYSDVHSVQDSSSIQPAQNYNYCIETYSTHLGQAYPQVCDQGSTFDINFIASDGVPTNQIVLTWEDLSSFADKLEVRRNGVLLKSIFANQNSYTDLAPIFGRTTEYSLTLFRNDVEILTVRDQGFAEANGQISGRVITSESGYPVENVSIELRKDTIIQNSTSQITVASTQTDFEGNFIFSQIVYGLSQDYTIHASKGNNIFEENDLLVTLTSANPVVSDVVFKDETILNESISSVLIDTFIIEKFEIEDKVELTWDYNYTGAVTTFFQILRNGEEIFAANDLLGKITEFVDLSGSPGIQYNYTLLAFQKNGNSVLKQNKKLSTTYPILDPVNGFLLTKGTEGAELYNPTVYLDWSNANYASENFDGFRIYRDQLPVGEVDNNKTSFSIVSIPGTTSSYQIRSFRKIDEVDFLSLPHPISNDSLITANNLFTPFVVDPVSDGSPESSERAITISAGQFETGFTPDFFQNAFYEGILIERKETQNPVDSFEIVGTLPKNFIALQAQELPNRATFWDQKAIAGQNYNYRVSTYFTLNDIIYFQDTIVSRIAPDFISPANFSAVPDTGKVQLSWTDNSEEVNLLSQVYLHYEGYEIYRKDITNNGNSTLVATLSAKEEQYNDYVNNKVYNVFLDEYIHIDYEYYLRAYVDIEGVRYYAPTQTLQSGPLDGAQSEPLVDNVTASKDIPNHVKLCWEWNAAKPSQFIISREGVVIDTVSSTSREYYDYSAPKLSKIEYAVQSLFNHSESEKVFVEGGIPSAVVTVRGRIQNKYTGEGIPNVVMRFDPIFGGTFPVSEMTTKTDGTGNYYFRKVPKSEGLNFFIKASGDNIDFDSTAMYKSFASTLVEIDTADEYIINFTDYQQKDSSTTISGIQQVIAYSNQENMSVDLTWSPKNENYDGFEIRRLNKLIADIPKENTFEFQDVEGFSGLVYIYEVKAYKVTSQGRKYGIGGSAGAVYPTLKAVDNLTITPMTAKNLMTLSWSHSSNKNDFYRVRRDGIQVAALQEGEPLTWNDSTGVPGQVYQYEVDVVKKGKVSPTRSIVSKYKGVSEVTNLEVEIPTIQACSYAISNQNHALISWNYELNAANGFEVYRDGKSIAIIRDGKLVRGNKPLKVGDLLRDNNTFYYLDYEGTPGANHTYHVLAFVERANERVYSGVEELFLNKTISYPQLAEVRALSVVQNNILGAVSITFEYDSLIVLGYELLRNGIILDTILENNQGFYQYNDFTGLPGATYSYSVRAYDKRNGINYLSPHTCEGEVQFPIVPTPQNLSASKGTFTNHIEVNWDFDALAFVDSFYLENLATGELYTYPSGRRKHVETVNNPVSNKYTYRIRANRQVEGQVIYSDWSALDEGWAQSQINGTEDENILGSCKSNRLGTDVAIDGDWAIAGSVDGEENVAIYRRVKGGWSLFEEKTSPLVDIDAEFGKSVAISGNTFIVGAPNAKKVYVYTWDGAHWGFPEELENPYTGSDNERFGHSLDIFGDRITVGAPGNVLGGLYTYEKVNGEWTLHNTFANPSSEHDHFGVAVAISDDILISSVLYFNQHRVIYYILNSNEDWEYLGEYIIGDNFPSGSEIFVKDNIDLSGDLLAIGEYKHDNNKGRVFIYERDNNGSFQLVTTIEPGFLQNDDRFGEKVAIEHIPSPVDEAAYLVVGANGRSQNGLIESGAAYLYSNISGSWSLLQQIEPQDPEEYDEFGTAVGLSKDAVIVGIPLKKAYDIGAAEITNLIPAPTNVQATDGQSLAGNPANTTISWDYVGNKDLVAGFNIYRDDEFLVFRNKATLLDISSNTLHGEWDDNSAVRGKRYVYSVTSVNQEVPFESPYASDEGSNTADGILRGSVRTEMGFVNVPGVTITATGVVKNEIYTYTTTTLANGEYTFNKVYFDENLPTAYQVTAELGDHIIVPLSSDIGILNPLNDPTQAIVDFLDKTAYVIKGVVSRPDMECPVQGLKISLIKNGVLDLTNDARTDENGAYTLIVNPNEQGLNQIRVRIDTLLDEEGIKTNFAWEPDADTIFNNFTNFPFVNEINFSDVLTYNVDIKVKNTCNNAISTGQWDVRIRTLDGCYDEIHSTNSNGDLNLDLLPLNYVMSVVGVDVPSSRNNLALDYFKNFPLTLNLLDTHRDSIGTLTKTEIENQAKRQFTYHLPPSIEVSGLNNLVCDTETAQIQQGEEYTLGFAISEVHDGFSCEVQEGIIEINNPASASPDIVIIEYDPVTESFPEYTFTAGNPLEAEPHQYAVTFDYKSKDGVFIGRVIKPVFVSGSVSVGGTDIILDPSSGNDAVPYPLLVLRDPPGDNSSSYIESGQTISFTTTMTNELEDELSVYSETEATIADNGIGFSTNINTGFSKSKALELTNTVTTTNKISTSGDESQIGRMADVVVGAGLVMQYGLIYEFDIEGCDIAQTIKYGITPNSANTTWNYTVSQIEDIIKGYENNLAKIQNGTLDITRNGVTLSQSEATNFTQTLIENWKEILFYHDNSTVPFYHLCTFKPSPLSFAGGGLEQFNYWQAQIRPKFGNMVNGRFELKDDIVWDQQLIDLYNAAYFAMNSLASGGSPNEWRFPYIGDLTGIDLSIPLPDFSLVDLPLTLFRPELTDRTQTFGPQVRNLTVGGNVEIEESINNAQSSSVTLNSSVFVGTELDVQAILEGEFNISLGFFAGLGAGSITTVNKKLVKVESKIGVKNEFKFTNSNEQISTVEESVEVGYTLLDDDPMDAFSVAIIQGIDNRSTPYFDFFGGRTSCPSEEGALVIDNPFIGIKDLTTGGIAKSKTLNYVPESQAAVYTISIQNLTPLSSKPDRELSISLVQGSNSNGAIVTLNGVSLNNGNYVDIFPADTENILTLTIERGPVFYEYPNIQLVVEPTCGGGPTDEINVSTYFVNPCSQVSIVTPDNNWVLNQNRVGGDVLSIGIQDYDPVNTTFTAKLQYRRIGGGQAWTDVNVTQLEDNFEITSEYLAAYNAAEFDAFRTPIYFFTWTVPETEAFPDGNYELRVVMNCNNFTETISNVVSGTIARDGMELFATPEPADGIWTEGDEISFTFDKTIDCALINLPSEDISMVNMTTGDTLDFNMGCSANSSKLIFTLQEPMSNFDGQMLKVSVDNIPSLQGNISERHDWTFRVVTQNLYWETSDTIKLFMYAGTSRTINTKIESNANIDVSNVSISGDMDFTTLLSPLGNFAVTPSGQNVSIQVDADQGIGTHLDSLVISGSNGIAPKLFIQLEILNKPPDWEVDPDDYSESMIVVANWRYSNESQDAFSKDSSDLISVWIGDEIRGVGSIKRYGSFYNAYINVFGRPDDGVNTTLEFRVWDADQGVEYNAYPVVDFPFVPSSQRGTAALPEILTVDRALDFARYIPLRQGWTGFSLFTETSDMSTAYKLSSLDKVIEGDLLVTDDAFAIYDDSLGWVYPSGVGLEEISTNEGYMIYLQNGPDTLRVTGVLATPSNIQLKNGWNWIGFPFEIAENINPALNLNAENQQNSDRVKVDYPLPGGTPLSAAFSLNTGNWSGSLNVVEPNNLYKVYSGNPNGAMLSWLTQNSLQNDSQVSALGLLADPNEANTWGNPLFNADLMMPIIAEVVLADTVVRQVGDKIAVFEGDTLRGYGEIQFISSVNKYQVHLLVEKASGTFDIRYYDAVNDQLHTASNVLSFDIHGEGNIRNPYPIIFEVGPCPNVLILNDAVSRFDSNVLFEAAELIRITGQHVVANGVMVEFSAPKVIIEQAMDLGNGAHVTVKPDGCVNE